MAKDIQEVARGLLSRALENVVTNPPRGRGRHDSPAALGGMRGVAAGAGAAALVPAAVKLVRSGGLGKLAGKPTEALGGAASKLGDSVGEKVTDKVDEAGGPSGILKDALPFGGGGGGGTRGGAPGVGKGRRMPIQQSVDIGVPLETVYNQWTQYEDWPNFMHRVTRVSQEDETTVSFATKIWGKTKEFNATIETQRPDQRIKWRVSQGLTHQGVVTFHELGPSLTRVLLSMDVEPGGLLEKAARGMRHIKRAARADLHRFKAFVEMNERETGAWRGVIEDGEVVEDHDPSYDEDREYADVEELTDASGSDDTEDEDEDGGPEADSAGSEDDDSEQEEEERPRPRRRTRAASANGGSPRSSGSGSSGSSRSSGSSGGGRSRGRTASASSGSSSASGRRSSSSSKSSNGHAGRRRNRSGGRQSG